MTSRGKFLGGHWGARQNFGGAVAPLAPPSSAPDHLVKMIAYFFIQNCFKCDYDHHNTEYCCVWQRKNNFVT